MRFNQDCNTFDEVVEYYKNRAIQLLKYGFKLESLKQVYDLGVIAKFSKKGSEIEYYSIYLYASQRGKGYYDRMYAYLKNLVVDGFQILTSDECHLQDYLRKRYYEYLSIDFCIHDGAYGAISNFYGDQKAKRSDVYKMNHIDEGLAILNWIDAYQYAYEGYALHPIFQADQDLIECDMRALSNFDINIQSVVYAMEYRSVANAYLSNRDIGHIAEIKLSPLNGVNDMLIADKIQNRKDFELYHKGIHSNSDRLDQYFKDWLRRLNVSEETYQEYVRNLTVNPTIIH